MYQRHVMSINKYITISIVLKPDLKINVRILSENRTVVKKLLSFFDVFSVFFLMLIIYIIIISKIISTF